MLSILTRQVWIGFPTMSTTSPACLPACYYLLQRFSSLAPNLLLASGKAVRWTWDFFTRLLNKIASYRRTQDRSVF